MIRVNCKECGKELNADFNMDSYGDITIETEACPDCLAENEEKEYDKGYNEGYKDGVADTKED